MPLNDGERQVSPTLDGIRQDHVARYQWADQHIGQQARVIDLGCGIGYGSNLLARNARRVLGVDRDPETVAYAKQHYGGAEYVAADVINSSYDGDFDVAVAFEMIEHLADPLPVLKAIPAKTLLCSVPNETHFPFKNYRFHHRHYTEQEFRDLLTEAGWQVLEMKHQVGPESPVSNEPGRTLVARCERAASGPGAALEGKHLAICALGPSLNTFVDITKVLGGAVGYCDEVWAINAAAGSVVSDRMVHMDDLRVQEARAAARPQSNIAHMLRFMQTYPGPIITSHVDDDLLTRYPTLTTFPLQDVVNDLNLPYFNNTAAHAVALAIHYKVKRISLFGADYSYEHSHYAERGRGCVEYWLGAASQRGIKVTLPSSTAMMDALEPLQNKIYGYDGYDLSLEEDGKTIRMEPRTELPSVEEIERRYDHTRPTNELVRRETGK